MKRLTCTRCGAENEHDVPLHEKTAPLREVRCRACGHRFSYGFSPEYVTEAEPEPHESRAADDHDPFDGAAEAVKARDRLVKYVARYPEYADRDRDVLLLHLLDMTDHVDHELAGIKRAIDVLIKRVSR